jgi:hypothetical protein
MGEIQKMFVSKPEGKKPLGRPRNKWENKVKVDLKNFRWEGVDLIPLAQVRIQWRAAVNTVVNLNGSRKGGDFLTR